MSVDDTKISVQHTSGEIIASWQLLDLANRFIEKILALLFVSVHTEEKNGNEYFHFYRAQLMRETFAELLSELFKTGNLLVDLRLHDKKTSARNHGTGFRVFEDKLPLLFRKIEDIN